jgi:hypothetical protein
MKSRHLFVHGFSHTITVILSASQLLLKQSAADRGCVIIIIWLNNNNLKPKSDRREKGGIKTEEIDVST